MDYYTDFCFEIEGNADELKAMFLLYDLLLENPNADALVDDIREIAREEQCYPGIMIEVRGDTATLMADSPNFTVIEKIIQAWMRRYDRDGWISFEYSMSASRPTKDAYGGGVVWISKDRIVEASSSDLIHVDPLKVEKLIEGDAA